MNTCNLENYIAFALSRVFQTYKDDELICKVSCNKVHTLANKRYEPEILYVLNQVANLDFRTLLSTLSFENKEFLIFVC